MRRVTYLAALLLAVGVLVEIDRSPSDVANQAALLVIALAAALLGLAAPRRAWLSGLVVGGALAVAHALYLLAGLSLPYPMSPAGWAGPLTLLALVVPALLAAYAGAWLGSGIRRSSSRA